MNRIYHSTRQLWKITCASLDEQQRAHSIQLPQKALLPELLLVLWRLWTYLCTISIFINLHHYQHFLRLGILFFITDVFCKERKWTIHCMLCKISHHRITKAGKDLQDHSVQLSTYHQYFSTKPCPSVPQLNVSWTSPGTVTQSLPWAAHQRM